MRVYSQLLSVVGHAGASIYSGTMKGGKKEGLGWQRLANGYEFMGYFENDLRHGYGTFKVGESEDRVLCIVFHDYLH